VTTEPVKVGLKDGQADASVPEGVIKRCLDPACTLDRAEVDKCSSNRGCRNPIDGCMVG
jgi:hypothetical protein